MEVTLLLALKKFNTPGNRLNSLPENISSRRNFLNSKSLFRSQLDKRNQGEASFLRHFGGLRRIYAQHNC